ncbi:MAG: hypothetical protein JJE12_02865 [Anaerolineales bacterium]|nr:hypothetical protein [Anaerolineales bacterium]
MRKAQDVISVVGLRKQYGSLTAAEGVSFEVQAGEIFGLVGPNSCAQSNIAPGECLFGSKQLPQDLGIENRF